MDTQRKLGAAMEYAKSVLGGPVVESEKTTSVGTTPLEVAIGNGDRVGLVLVNLGAADVFVSIASNVGATSGILLAANGGNLSLTVVFDFTLVTRAFQAVCPAGGPSNVYALSYQRYAESEVT